MATKIKICGITRPEDGWAAHEAGADALGMVFYAKSSRAVTAEQVAQWRGELPPLVTVVGLFVNADPDTVRRTIEMCALDRVQLHGDETPEGAAQFGARSFKALRVAEAGDLSAAETYSGCGLLLDAKVKGAYGGTGASFDWSLLSSWQSPKPLLLAGGLNPDNVADAVRQVRPYGVDVSSGVEASPGIKDVVKMQRFCAEVRRADGEN
uniref:N-(5'-phosphoribosyl)anthranilate isomerase n=1 Tax=Magnetococcus massalia (strain MO-1) TaxID=451514 RepID=A0A1S7LII3_MAGMO|nr:N-(5'-phosphoribosyl)anthranilate isomerase [Candidatus Magnetococcus massalia]